LGFLALIGGVIEYWMERKKEQEKSKIKEAEEIGLLSAAIPAHPVEVSEESLPKYTRFFLAFSPITNFKVRS
jgi:hypothetical protein